MIKICHIVDDLGIGGLEMTVKNIVLNLNKKEFQQEIWCLAGKGVLAEEIERNDIEVKLFNYIGKLNMSLVLRLAGELRRGRYDLIHSHGFFPSIWARMASIFARGPVNIIHCQNMYYDIIRKDRIKEKLLALSTAKFIAVSEAVKRSLVDFIGINPSKIKVIYNCTRKMKPQDLQQKQKTMQELGITDDNFVIGNISRLIGHKGHHYLIDAVSQLTAYIPGLRCIIVGDGPAMDDLKFKVKKLNLERAIIFTGWRKDIENLLSIMNVFVQPSTLTEGLCLSLIEAASAGLPLIGTDIGGIPEIIENGTNGFIIPSQDSTQMAEKIKYLWKEADIRKKMGENAIETWKKKFSLEKMIHEIEDVYKYENGKYYHSKF
jgi:glycosyltransferase involved in cell wall biosynthesis